MGLPLNVVPWLTARPLGGKTPKGGGCGRAGEGPQHWACPHYLPHQAKPPSSPSDRRSWKGNINRSRQRTHHGGFARPGSHFTVMLKMEMKDRCQHLYFGGLRNQIGWGTIPAGMGAGAFAQDSLTEGQVCDTVVSLTIQLTLLGR